MQVQKRVIIATHVLNYGAAHALRDFLIRRKYSLLFIGLPFHDQKKTIIEAYKNGEQIEEEKFLRKDSSQILSFIKDFRQVIVAVTNRQKYDTFVGVNNLNCLSGIVLKKIGKIKRVIYYSIDFVPTRFQNTILNTIYHQIEIFCVKNADEVWNVSPRIADGREEFLHVLQKKYRQKVVPIGVWSKEIKRLPKEKIKNQQILFVGHLLEKQGVQLVLESVPDIIKVLPSFRFLIIGDGEYGDSLKRLVRKLKLSKHVIFTGWIFDRKRLVHIMGESSLGVAMYKPEKERLHNFSYFADPTKIKDYLSVGLPVIMTDVPYNAEEVVRKKAGVVVEYQKEKLAEAILSLLNNKQRLERYRNNAFNFASEFDWNVIFNKTSI